MPTQRQKAAAYVTLLSNVSYLPATLVLEQSIRAVNSRYPLIVMATTSLAGSAKQVLKKRGVQIVDVDSLQPEPGIHKLAEGDTRFADTWTKLRAFGLSQYERVVLLDSDMILFRNMDELMDLDLPADWIAAAHACTCNPRKFSHYPPDWIPENCAHTSVSHPGGLKSPPPITGRRTYTLLNSGTVILSPSDALMNSIELHLSTSPNVSGYSFPDQDLLAEFFQGRWKPLPYCYNALKTLRIIHSNLWRDEEVRCLHYILPDKPWHTRVGKEGKDEYDELHKWWWEKFYQLEEEMQSTDDKGWNLVLENVA